jgi:hypothetical protein
MVWFNPLSWFKRNVNSATQQAANLRKGAEGALKSALTQYINAVKVAVKNNAAANISAILRNTNYIVNGQPSGKILNKVNMAITNLARSSAAGLSKAAQANNAKKAANTAAEAAKANAQSAAAAAAMKRAARSAKNLNAIFAEVFKGVNVNNANALAAAYGQKRLAGVANNNARKAIVNANKALNGARGTQLKLDAGSRFPRRVPIPSRYSGLWAALSGGSALGPEPNGPNAVPPNEQPPEPQGNPALNDALTQLKNAVSKVENANVNNNSKYASRTNTNNLNRAVTNALVAVNAINNTAGGSNRNKALKIKAALNRVKAAAAAGAAPPAPPGAPGAINRSALNALLASTNNATVGAMNITAVNNRKNAIRTAANAVGITNLKGNATIRPVLNRLNAHKAALNPQGPP